MYIQRFKVRCRNNILLKNLTNLLATPVGLQALVVVSVAAGFSYWGYLSFFLENNLDNMPPFFDLAVSNGGY